MPTLMLICFFLLAGSYSFTQEKEFPVVFDFSSSEIPGSENFDMSKISKLHPFNEAAELAPFFSYLKTTYRINKAVETGTFHGRTTAFFGYLFDKTFSIEVEKEYYDSASKRLRKCKNIDLFLGSSPLVLSQILPKLKDERLLFYLDAHWQADWPLLKELEEIGKTHRDNCIIVIDDIKVPGRADIPYDSYEGQECSHDYICDHLDKVFSSYKIHYLIPKSVERRAKFVAIPTKWMD